MDNLPVSPSGRRYGRFQPPPMPIRRMLRRALPPGAPLFKDFRTADQGGTNPATAFCSPVKDQKTESSCTGHEKATNGEWIERAYFKRQTLFSPQYVYAKELIADGNFPNDVGSNGETGCLVVIEDGLCEAAAYPYVAGDIETPTPAQDTNAAQYKMGAYHGISDAMTAISCLSDPVPWPVGIGFEVFESFESNEVAQSGVMPIPASSEQLLGGHQVAACVASGTRIPLLSGADVEISSLEGKRAWVYSISPTGKIVPGEAINIRRTGTRDVIRIHLDSEEYLDCTDDHLILLRDGTYLAAG